MINISAPYIGKEEIESVVAVMRSGMIAQGVKVEELEENFAKFCKTKHAVAVSSGTSALHTALHCLGIGPGDEVITTPFTFVATANSILMAGATPVFIDIQTDTFNLNPELIEEKITKKTKAILTVNLYGQPADYKDINRIAKKHKLFVIEDAAQSIGSTYQGKKSGNLADIACFSLYATKNVISGEGGMITMNNKTFDAVARRFRHHGQDEKKRYKYFGLGYNYRMTDLQAAIAIEQLRRIDILTKKRQEIAKIYNLNFKNIKGLITPSVIKHATNVYHQYTLRITKECKLSRDQFKSFLEEKGIQVNIYYPIPLYRFSHLFFGGSPRNFPITELITSEVLSIPVHPKLTNEQVQYIVNTIKNI